MHVVVGNPRSRGFGNYGYIGGAITAARELASDSSVAQKSYTVGVAAIDTYFGGTGVVSMVGKGVQKIFQPVFGGLMGGGDPPSMAEIIAPEVEVLART